MSAEEISQALGVEVHKISMCLLRLKRQDLVEAPESAKRRRDLAPRPGHRDRARQFYNINPTKGLKRLRWYTEQERLLREPKQELQPEEPEQQVKIKKPKREAQITKPEQRKLF
jgi:hypothetical protein